MTAGKKVALSGVSDSMLAYLLKCARLLARYENRAGKAVLVADRVDYIANRVMVFARRTARFESDSTIWEELTRYKDGMVGPMLKEKPVTGFRCGIWNEELKRRVLDPYWDERALWLVANPVAESVLYAMTAHAAANWNEWAEKRVTERNLTA